MRFESCRLAVADASPPAKPCVHVDRAARRHRHQSYGYNHNGYENGVGPEKFLGLGGSSLLLPTAESEVVAPSEMIAIGDGAINGPSNAVAASDIGFRRMDNMFWSGDFTGWILRAKKRHRGKANIVFCDGHVEAFKLQALFLNKADEALRRWNKDNEPDRNQP